MNNIVKIIESLGVNQTIFVQFGIFLVVFVILRAFVFKPYYRAYEKRKSETVGNDEAAGQLATQAHELEALYQAKARTLNADIKEIFDKARLEGAVEQEKIFADARERAHKSLEKERARIQDEVSRARDELSRETPELGAAIADRLLTPGGPAA